MIKSITISGFEISHEQEPWALTVVKHRINKNIPGLGPQKMYCSHVISAAEMARLSRMTRNRCISKSNTELAYCELIFCRMMVIPVVVFLL